MSLRALLAAAPAPSTLDLVAAVVLLACTAWGAWRGALAQVLGLTSLLGALLLASPLAPLLRDPVRQALAPAAGDLPLAAWAAAFLGVLLVVGVLSQALGALRPRAGALRPASRWGGALLGAGKGLLVLLVAGYAVALRAPPSPPSGSLWLRLLPRARALVEGPLALAPEAARRLDDLDADLRPLR